MTLIDKNCYILAPIVNSLHLNVTEQGFTPCLCDLESWDLQEKACFEGSTINGKF